MAYARRYHRRSRYHRSLRRDEVRWALIVLAAIVVVYLVFHH